MPTQAAERRRDLHGPNLVDERSTLLLAGDPGRLEPALGSRVPASGLAQLWSELARIGVESNPVPADLRGGEAIAGSVAPLVELALQFALTLLHRYEAEAPSARMLAGEPSRLVVAIRCEEHELAARAWALAVDALASLHASRGAFAEGELHALRERHRRFVEEAGRRSLSPDTLALLRELRRRDLPTERLLDGFDVVQVGQGRLRRRFEAARMEFTSARAARLVRAERAFRLALERASLPVAGASTGTDLVVWVVDGRARAALRLEPAGERDLDEAPPPAAIRLAQRCASALDLDPAALRIRMVAAQAGQAGQAGQDSRSALPYGDLAVVAASSPGRLPSASAPIARRRVIAALADRLAQGIGDGRVAGVWLTGCGGAGLVFELLEAILQRAGRVPGVQAAGSARIAGRVVEPGAGRAGGAWPLVMLDPRVDVAVIGIDAQDVLERGLGVDACDVAVWRSAATPAPAHDAAGDAIGRVDALVLSRARSAVVLDADDSRWPAMRACSRAPGVWLVSRRPPREAFEGYVAAGGAAAWVEPDGEGAAIVACEGGGTSLRVAVPVRADAGGGADGCPTAEATLFAVAAARALGIAAEAIVDALGAFGAALGAFGVTPAGATAAGARTG